MENVMTNMLSPSEALIEHFATEDNPFHFTDSGLDNVYLVGIKYFTSESGRIVAEVPAVNQLMRLIARGLIFSPNSLRGEEIRFLRKRLGKKATDYSHLLRVNAETLSRIENEKQQPSDQLDSLVRMSYLLLSGDTQLAENAKELARVIETEIRRGEIKIIMKVSPQNEWSDATAA